MALGGSPSAACWRPPHETSAPTRPRTDTASPHSRLPPSTPAARPAGAGSPTSAPACTTTTSSWNDADTLVTNRDISLERILFFVIGHSDCDASPDLILMEDFNGVNASMGDLRTILMQSMLPLPRIYSDLSPNHLMDLPKIVLAVAKCY